MTRNCSSVSTKSRSSVKEPKEREVNLENKFDHRCDMRTFIRNLVLPGIQSRIDKIRFITTSRSQEPLCK